MFTYIFSENTNLRKFMFTPVSDKNKKPVAVIWKPDPPPDGALAVKDICYLTISTLDPNIFKFQPVTVNGVQQGTLEERVFIRDWRYNAEFKSIQVWMDINTTTNFGEISKYIGENWVSKSADYVDVWLPGKDEDKKTMFVKIPYGFVIPKNFLDESEKKEREPITLLMKSLGTKTFKTKTATRKIAQVDVVLKGIFLKESI